MTTRNWRVMLARVDVHQPPPSVMLDNANGVEHKPRVAESDIQENSIVKNVLEKVPSSPSHAKPTMADVPLIAADVINEGQIISANSSRERSDSSYGAKSFADKVPQATADFAMETHPVVADVPAPSANSIDHMNACPENGVDSITPHNHFVEDVAADPTMLNNPSAEELLAKKDVATEVGNQETSTNISLSNLHGSEVQYMRILN